MICTDKRGVAALKNTLRRMDYLFVCKNLRGAADFQDPWYHYPLMEEMLETLDSPYRETFRLFVLGTPVKYASFAAELGEETAADLFSTGIWYRDGDEVKTNNYVILYYQGITVVVEINPWYDTCINRNTDVYIGSDSLLLAEKLPYRRGAVVLDLCSGSGIQGLLAARSAKKVISVELNPKASPMTRFNVLLNGMEDIVEVREGDLYTVLKPEEKFDCIYANPPFIPMLDTVEYPICGAGGEDGLMVLRKILAGIPERLNKNGEVIIFCECLGDENGVFFDTEVEKIVRENDYSCIVMRHARLNGGVQIERLADLTVRFNEKGFDAADFKEKMRNIYARLGAKYLYSLVYKINNIGEKSELRYIDYINHWHYEDRAELAPEVTAKRCGDYIDFYRAGKLNARCDMETYKLVRLLKNGYTVEKATKLIYMERRGFLGKGGKSYYKLLDEQLIQCNSLEKSGLISRVPAGGGK